MPPEKHAVPNRLLIIAQILTEDASWEEIVPFSQTFDGYSEWGSQIKCAEVANARRHNTLTELRTRLFFEQRRWNHYGERPDAESMKYVHSLLVAIRKKVSEGNID